MVILIQYAHLQASKKNREEEEEFEGKD